MISDPKRISINVQLNIASLMQFNCKIKARVLRFSLLFLLDHSNRSARECTKEVLAVILPDLMTRNLC